MPEKSMAIGVRDETKTKTAVEQGLRELLVELAPMTKGMIRMLVVLAPVGSARLWPLGFASYGVDKVVAGYLFAGGRPGGTGQG